MAVIAMKAYRRIVNMLVGVEYGLYFTCSGSSQFPISSAGFPQKPQASPSLLSIGF